MGEPVRLVVWDLDDTFWRGTLSEGGIQAYIQEHHDIVVELARRGIMNSICSKNDIAAVRSTLQEKGLWDYFIFPSIDWSPKGPRIANLIETVQLRPASILFIDDNPNNRAEAQAAVPDLRVADEKCVSNILQDPLCRGKNDATLTRLAQYKLLEARKADERAAGKSDNLDFLRGCGIKVAIETDIEAHLDRAVELINRTNQLNFTKVRLSDDPALAKQELAAHVGQYFVQAGLVRVSDKYGDYGFCGFYSKHNDNNDIPGRLVHFCFSCRTLGMGVEHWLYEKLRRPPVKVRGDVLVDLQDKKNVDWISQSTDPASAIEVPGGPDAIPEIRFHGGCDLSAVAHYFKLAGNVTCLESNYKKDEILFVRKDFSCSLLNALEWNAQMQRDCLAVGYGEGDVRSGFLADALPGSLLVYSGWGDVDSPLYRHRELGFRIPCLIEILKALDITRLSAADISTYADAKEWDAAARAHFHQALDVLRQTYAYDGLPAPEVIFDNMRRIFDHVPRGALLVVILPHEFQLGGGRLSPRARATTYNQTLRSLAARYDNVMLVDIAEFIEDTGDKLEGADHFHRIIYYRLFQAIMARAKPCLRALRIGQHAPA